MILFQGTQIIQLSELFCRGMQHNANHFNRCFITVRDPLGNTALQYLFQLRNTSNVVD